jgi:hypothetical protein
MVVVLEKHIVRRTSRLIRVRRLMSLLSIFCVYGILVEPDNPKALAEALRLSIANNEYMTVVKRFSSEKTGSSYEALFAGLVDSLKIDDYSASQSGWLR